MALTKQVALAGVSEAGMAKMWRVSLTLTVTDDAGPGFARTFAQNYKQGRSIPDLFQAFRAEMQAAINKYKGERAVATHALMASLVSAVDDGLEV